MEDLNYWTKLAENKDDASVPMFENRPFEIRSKDKEGNEVIEYEDRIFVRIMNRGDSKNVIERWLRDEDEKRWPEHLKAFRANTEPPVDGTPLSQFPALTPADIENCKRKHVRTVEDLASFPDIEIGKLRNGFRMREAAKQFLEYRNDVPSLVRQIEDLKKELKELKDGNTATDGAERAGGDGVSDTEHSGNKQQSGRKKTVQNRKKSGRQSG